MGSAEQVRTLPTSIVMVSSKVEDQEKKLAITQQSVELLPSKKNNFAIPNMLFFKKNPKNNDAASNVQKMAKCHTEKNTIGSVFTSSMDGISPRPRFLISEILKYNHSAANLGSPKPIPHDAKKTSGGNVFRSGPHNPNIGGIKPKTSAGAVRSSVRSLSPELSMFRKPVTGIGSRASPKGSFNGSLVSRLSGLGIDTHFQKKKACLR